MSILAAAEPVSAAQLAFASLLAAFGLTAAYAIGVFRGERLAGPIRIPHDESLRPVLLAALLGLAAWFGLQAAYGVYMAVSQRLPGDAAPRGDITFAAHDYAILGTVPFIAGLLALIGADVLASRQLPQRLGWSLDRLAGGFLRGLAGILILVPMLLGASYWMQAAYNAVGYEHPTAHEMLKVLAESRDPLVRAALILGATILAPLFEEFFFRGHVQTILLRLFAPRPPHAPAAAARWAAIALAAVLFTVLHPAWTWPLIFILALGMGYAYERTGNLWVPVFIHLFFNTINTLVTLLTQTQPFEPPAPPL